MRITYVDSVTGATLTIDDALSTPLVTGTKYVVETFCRTNNDDIIRISNGIADVKQTVIDSIDPTPVISVIKADAAAEFIQNVSMQAGEITWINLNSVRAATDGTVEETFDLGEPDPQLIIDCTLPFNAPSMAPTFESGGDTWTLSGNAITNTPWDDGLKADFNPNDYESGSTWDSVLTGEAWTVNGNARVVDTVVWKNKGTGIETITRTTDIRFSDDVTQPEWTKFGGTTTPDAETVANLSGSDERISQPISFDTANQTILVTVELKGEGANIGKTVSISATNNVADTPALQVTLTGDWVQHSLEYTFPAASSLTGQWRPVNSRSATGDTATEVKVRNITCENITGREGIAPMYIPVDTPTGSELVTNGDFQQAGSSWTTQNEGPGKTITFSVGSVRYESDDGTPTLALINAPYQYTTGTRYVVSSEGFVTSGSVKAPVFGDNLVNPGNTYVYTASANDGFALIRNAVPTDVTFTRISIREATTGTIEYDLPADPSKYDLPEGVGQAVDNLTVTTNTPQGVPAIYSSGGSGLVSAAEQTIAQGWEMFTVQQAADISSDAAAYGSQSVSGLRLGHIGAGNLYADFGFSAQPGAADTEPHLHSLQLTSGGNLTYGVSGVGSALRAGQVGTLDWGSWFSQFDATTPYTGWIGEVIVFDRVLTDDERTQVQTYLVEKWLTGFTGNAFSSGFDEGFS